MSKFFRTKECFAYRDGHCDRGEQCRYIHAEKKKNNSSSSSSSSSSGKKKVEVDMEAYRQSVLRGTFKTKQCRFWVEGNCEFGELCTYIHGEVPEPKEEEEEEPREHDPSKYRTVTCWHWKAGKCKDGDNCTFLHADQEEGEEEPKHKPKPKKKKERKPREHNASKYKTVTCWYWKAGKCNDGDDCTFLHADQAEEKKDEPTQLCTNCQSTDHVQEQCAEPCSICASFKHYTPTCEKNKSDPVYVPFY